MQSPPLCGQTKQFYGDLGLTKGARAKVIDLINSCEPIAAAYHSEDNLCEPVVANPTWGTIGLVAEVQRQGGWWRVTCDDANPLSIVSKRDRCLAIVDGSGKGSNPPAQVSAKVFITPAPPNGAFFGVAMFDLAHGVGIVMLAAEFFGPFQWILLLQNGIDPDQFIPTGLPVTMDCPSAQTVSILVTPTQIVASANGAKFVTPLPNPANFTGHLFAPASAAIQNLPGNTGSIDVNWFCERCGYGCVEDPGTLPFPPATSTWIQSAENHSGGDQTFSDTDPNWTALMSVGMTTGANFLIITAIVSSENDTVGVINRFRIVLDGSPITAAANATTLPTDDEPQAVGIKVRISVAAGPHTVELQGQVSAGTGTIKAASKPTEENASLVVEEVAT